MGVLRNSSSVAFSTAGMTSPSGRVRKPPILRRDMILALAVAVIPALVLPPLLLPLRSPPLFAALPVLPLGAVYVRAIAARKPARATLLAVAWAVALTLSTVASAARSPQAVPSGIWHAAAYRDEMLRWIATGAGAEGNIVQFLPRVLGEYVM